MNKWDERYSASDYVYGTEPNAFLAEHAHLLPPGDVLCLADGEGRNGVFLAQRGYRVTSVDSSAKGLAKANALAAQRNAPLQTVHCDLAEFAFPENHFTGIVSIFCHLPPALRRNVHRQAVNALTSGGVFVLEAYTPDQLTFRTGGPPSIDLLVTASQLQSELSGLDFHLARETTREVVEGSLHTGLGAVVQVIATKP